MAPVRGSMVFTDVPVSTAVASTAAGSMDEVFTDDLVSLTGDAASVGAAVLSTVALIAADSVAEIVASTAAVADSVTEIVASTAAVANSEAEIVASMAAVVDSTEAADRTVEAVDFMAVAATEADTGKTI